MKKVIVMTLICSMCMVFVMGCNGDTDMVEDGQSTEDTSVATSEEVVSEEVSDSEAVEPEMSEEVSEMTLEEKILAEMPAKLEVGEDEIIVPETVTAEQIMGRWEEIKVTDHEYAERINKMNLAGMLVLNCSYMEPTGFNALVSEYFGSIDDFWPCYKDYITYLTDGGVVYGSDIVVAPEKLLFDEYLINQSEQITYLVGLYQTDTENSKTYYDILLNYLAYDENEFFTFDCDDERLKGSGLAVLQEAALRSMMNDIIEYDTDLYVGDNIFGVADTKIWNIVNGFSE